MKCSLSIQARWASALLVLMVLLASCSKEPLVAPADAGVAGSAKNTTMPTDGGFSEPSTGSSAAPKSGEDDGGDGTGISDDGDDISGSERNRKKTS